MLPDTSMAMAAAVVSGLDRLARSQLLIERKRGPRRSFVRSRLLLLGIALRRLEDDDDAIRPRMSQVLPRVTQGYP